MIKLSINGIPVEIKSVAFSDGAKSFSLPQTLPRVPSEAVIYARPEGSLPELLFEVAQAVDVLRRVNSRMEIKLLMPYVPYARQDRPMVAKDSFSLSVFASLLNSLNLDKVVVIDAHSDISCALIKNSVEIKQHQVIGASRVLFCLSRDYVLVAPDAGSLKKINKVSEVLNPVGNVIMGKERDVTTGRITGSRIIDCDLSSLQDRKCLIVDDICDGGATFIDAAKVLKKAGAKQVDLWVTHGIFSRGVNVLFEGGIDHIFTTNSIYRPNEETRALNEGNLLTCFNLASILSTSFFNLGVN